MFADIAIILLPTVLAGVVLFFLDRRKRRPVPDNGVIQPEPSRAQARLRRKAGGSLRPSAPSATGSGPGLRIEPPLHAAEDSPSVSLRDIGEESPLS